MFVMTIIYEINQKFQNMSKYQISQFITNKMLTEFQICAYAPDDLNNIIFDIANYQYGITRQKMYAM